MAFLNGNLGRARVFVLLNGGFLRNVEDSYQGKESFDFSIANDWDQVVNNSDNPPRKMEVITDSKSPPDFAVMHPAKRYGQLNNRMYWIPSAGVTAAPTEIVWTPLECKRSRFLGHDHLYNLIYPGPPINDTPATGNEIKMSPHPNGGNYDAAYTGPQWRVNLVPKEPVSQADDQAPLTGTTDDLATGGILGSTGEAGTPASTGTIYDDHAAAIEQYRFFERIWWGVQTDLNLKPNIPLYVSVDRSEGRNLDGQPGCVMIRLNPPSADSGEGAFTSSPNIAYCQCLDLVLENGKYPTLYDWAVKADPKSDTFLPLPTDMPSLGPTPSSGLMRIGFLPVCGKLAIYLNDQMFLYSRPVPYSNRDKDKKDAGQASAQTFAYEPFTTQVKILQVFGTNSQAMVSVAAMRFAIGVAALPFTGRTNPGSGATDLAWGAPVGAGSETDPTIPGTKIWKLHQAEKPSNTASGDSNRTAYGLTYSGMDPTDPVLKNIKFVGYGGVKLQLGPSSLSSSADDQARMYQIVMYPQKMPFIPSADLSTQENLPIGPPFLQRLRGDAKMSKPGGGFGFPPIPATVKLDLSEDVISVNDTWTSPDRVMTSHTVEITLYNDQGQYDDLLKKCYGITIAMDWDKATMKGDGTLTGYAPTRLFTGATYGGASTVKAGRETVTITCQDYMALLEHTQMINSPYYDGMDVYDAINDLAQRARIKTVDDTDGSIRYYLPSGYSWTQPRMRFSGQSSVKDNMNEMVKLCERVVYFDEEGILHLAHLQGGLFGAFTDIMDPRYKFRRQPIPASGSVPVDYEFHVILNERKIDYKLSSTINEVLLKTVDRVQGAVYMISRRSPPSGSSQSRFPYKKQLMMDQSALGSVAAANYYADQLIERFSRIPKSISFNTLLAPGVKLHPMDVIYVEPDVSTVFSDGLMRVQTITRTYEAESNSIECSLACEWYSDE